MTKECVMQAKVGPESEVQRAAGKHVDLWSLDISEIPSLYENYRIPTNIRTHSIKLKINNIITRHAQLLPAPSILFNFFHILRTWETCAC